jgi:uncharacterized membrane protein
MGQLKKTKYLKWFRLAYVILPVAGIINIIFSPLIRSIINRQFNKIRGFSGGISGLKIGILEGYIECSGFYFARVDTMVGPQLKFISVKTARINFDKKSLWNGIIKFGVYADSPIVILMKDMKGISISNFNQDIEVVFTDCTLHNGTIKYIDNSLTPTVEIAVNQIEVNGINGPYKEEITDQLPFEAKISATIYEGLLDANIKANITASNPVFDLTTQIRGVDISKLNGLLDAYAHFTVNKGRFDVFSEIAAKDGHFKGYVKPIIEGLEFIGPKDKHDGIGRLLWEGLLGTLTEIFKNHSQDEIATKVNIEGTFKDPKVNIWYAIGETLKNAFVHGLCACIDHEISLSSVTKG